MEYFFLSLILPIAGVVVLGFGALCAASPKHFLKINKAMSQQVMITEKISPVFRYVVGLGLVWVGIFLIRLPGQIPR